MESETAGSRIRARRLELGITPSELAGRVGLNVRAVNRIETGLMAIAIIADYLPSIATELRTTTDVLLNGELHAERLTREELGRMKTEGLIRDNDEIEQVYELATATIRKRSKVNIPLNRQELLNLIEVIRGADGL